MNDGMVYFIASSTYYQVIQSSVNELGLIVAGKELSSDLYLLKYLKENMGKISGNDFLIIDISALLDTDDEIVSALEMMKIMTDKLKIIIVAANRSEGDELLTKCFYMSIYDIIATDDFNEIRNELKICLEDGKQYKDSLRFKEVKKLEKVMIKQEIKQTVYKIMIGIAGTTGRIGTTHNSIVLANYLRKRGFMVALVEANKSGAYEQIQESFEEKKYEDYFSINGVDYYAAASVDQIGNVLGKSYNFIIVDFGTFEEMDRISFNKSDVRIIITGSKPWEIDAINNVFKVTTQETLQGYQFYFNFTSEKERKDVKDGMEKLASRTHFLEMESNPFLSINFPDAEIVLEQYMPIKNDTTKKNIFSRREKL